MAVPTSSARSARPATRSIVRPTSALSRNCTCSRPHALRDVYWWQIATPCVTSAKEAVRKSAKHKVEAASALRSSRRALSGAPPEEILRSIELFTHPEEAAKQLSRRMRHADPANRQFPHRSLHRDDKYRHRLR